MQARDAYGNRLDEEADRLCHAEVTTCRGHVDMVVVMYQTYDLEDGVSMCHPTVGRPLG